MMSADQSLLLLYQNRDGIADPATTTNLVFASKSPDRPPTFLTRYVQLHQRLVGDVKSISARSIKTLCESQLLSYDPSYKLDPFEAMYIDLESNSFMGNFVSGMVNILDQHPMTDDPEFCKNLSLYGILHKINHRNLLLLRHVSAKNVLTRSKKIGVFFQGGVYDRLDREVLFLDKETDCVAYEGFLYIINMSGFHSLSQYRDQVIAAASDVIDNAARSIPILNLEDLQDIGRQDYRMAVKLASIKNKPYISTLTLERVKEIIQQNNLPIVVTRDADGIEKLVFDRDPQKRFLILKVLDDDYLHSNMTGQNYAVNSKIQMAA